jgi:thioredoxin reductase (NADPH)
LDQHDLIIVGAGPAGLAAGLYAGRSRLKTLVLESMMPGGMAAVTDTLENYPGVGLLNGPALTQRMHEQMSEFGAELLTAAMTGIRVADDGFVVSSGEHEYSSKALIAAMGTSYRKLGVPGEEEFLGRGVSYCATCDAPFYKGQEVAVVGGGDSALQEALYLTRFASKVYLIHRRDEFRAVPVLGERVRAHESIECLCSHTLQQVLGEGGVEALELRDEESGDLRTLNVPGVFIFIGLEPRTSVLKGLVKMDESGFVYTDQEMRTDRKGLLAAGDCRVKSLRQVSTAVGDGATAAFTAYRYVVDGEW